MTTLIYNGDGDLLGQETKPKKLSYWIRFGKVIKYDYLYKGFHYYEGEKLGVVVYTLLPWEGTEILRRTVNGFKGIREYYIGGSE